MTIETHHRHMPRNRIAHHGCARVGVGVSYKTHNIVQLLLFQYNKCTVFVL